LITKKDNIFSLVYFKKGTHFPSLHTLHTLHTYIHTHTRTHAHTHTWHFHFNHKILEKFGGGILTG